MKSDAIQLCFDSHHNRDVAVYIFISTGKLEIGLTSCLEVGIVSDFRGWVIFEVRLTHGSHLFHLNIIIQTFNL